MHLSRILVLLALTLTLGLAAPAAAHDGHKPSHVKANAAAGWSCSTWASNDPGHPNAPGSYRSYGCDNPEGDWVWVIGTGYSGTVHWSKLQRVCVWNTPFGCVTYAVYSREHGHS